MNDNGWRKAKLFVRAAMQMIRQVEKDNAFSFGITALVHNIKFHGGVIILFYSLVLLEDDYLFHQVHASIWTTTNRLIMCWGCYISIL